MYFMGLFILDPEQKRSIYGVPTHDPIDQAAQPNRPGNRPGGALACNVMPGPLPRRFSSAPKPEHEPVPLLCQRSTCQRQLANFR
jgi:hypothetical protein